MRVHVSRHAPCSAYIAARWLGVPVDGLALPLMMLMRRASKGLHAHTDDDYDSYSWKYYFRGQCTGGECMGSRLVVASGGDGGALAMVPTDPMTRGQMVAVAFNTQRSLHFVMSAEGSEDGPCPDFLHTHDRLRQQVVCGSAHAGGSGGPEVCPAGPDPPWCDCMPAVPP